MPGRHTIFTQWDWNRVTHETPWLSTISFVMLPIFTGQPYPYQTEWDLHTGIAKALLAARVPFRHEVTLGPGAKIDFVSRGVGLEVKAAGHPAVAAEQLRRYHATMKLEALVLLTTRADHSAEVPEHGLGGLTAVFDLRADRVHYPPVVCEALGLRPRRARSPRRAKNGADSPWS